MPALSFRLKLVLAMMLVVAGITGATLYVAQQRLATAHRRLFEEQFASQRQLLRFRQAARLKGFQAKTYRFARLVRLQALLRRLNAASETNDDADYAAAAERLYQTAEDDLREVLNPSNAEPGAPVAALFRLLDSKGQTIPPPKGIDVGRLRAEEETKLGRQLSAILAAQTDPAVSLIGHLVVEFAAGQRRLLEVIFTPVADVREGYPLGALVLGFPSPESDPEPSAGLAAGPAPAAVLGGIWLGGELYSRSIPAPARALLAREVAQSLPTKGAAEGTFNCALNDVPHRAFFADLQPAAAFPRACQVNAFSLAEARAEQQILRQHISGYGAVALAVALGVSGLLAQGLSGPIQALVAGTNEIQRGNFAIRVPVRTRDELGRLAESFNDMAVGLALKEKYRGVLNMVSDPRVAEELMRGQVALGGEEREVSVLFCDIRGFTALTQNMEPAEVVRLLNEHFTPLTRVVYEHHGVVDKFVGDLIMAVFGAPKSFGGDALNAARCGWRMIAARRALNETARHHVEIGIGIASGPALAGCMGSSDRLNYTVVGERVNLASRLCSQAARMEVILDQTTRDRVGTSAQVTPLPPLKLKGFSAPMPAYRLDGMTLVEPANELIVPLVT